MFLEHFKAVAVEHLCPQISVVASGIAVAAEYVVEVCRTIAELDFLRHTEFLCNRLLESGSVEVVEIGELVPFEVEQRRAYQLSVDKTLVELA